MPRNSDTVETYSVRGFVKALVFDKKQNKVVGYREFTNTVVDNGRDQIAKLCGNGTGFVTHGHVGSSTVGLATNNTALQAALGATPGRKAISTNSNQVSTGTIQWTWSYDTNEYTSTDQGSNFAEIGLFNSSAAGTMFARATFPSTTKDSNMQISFTYQLRFSTA